MDKVPTARTKNKIKNNEDTISKNKTKTMKTNNKRNTTEHI